MEKGFRISKRYLIGLLFTVILFLCTGRQVYTHITLNYGEDPTGDAYASVLKEDKVLAAYEVTEGVAELFFWGADFNRLLPIHYDSHEELCLTRLEIRMHGFLVADLKGEEILSYFTPNEDFEYVTTDAQGLVLKTQDEFPALVASEELREQMRGISLYGYLLNLLFYVLVYTLMYWYFFRVLKIHKEFSYDNVVDAVLGLIAVAALLLSWAIAFGSDYGVTVHPDEMQTRAAVDYYRTHWIQPDVRSEFVAGTVSGYGMTRLSEINLYYVFAGKFANLCVFEMSFRALGMLMFLVLTVFVLKRIKKDKYLAILFFATPQLWYLFSYATSDAYDYMFTVFAIYEVLSEHSSLNRILKEPFQRRHIPVYLGLGFVFANLLMAKKTFYLVLVTLFVLLLYRLIFVKKGEHRKLLWKYLGLLGVAFGIVFLRYIPDLYYYGLGKGEAVKQVIEMTALPEYKPSTPAILQAKSTLLYEKGVTLKEFFTEWNFNGELFKNFFGLYGIYSLKAKEWYYVVMGALYVCLLGTTGVLNHKCFRKKSAGVLKYRITYWSMWGLIGFMYLLTIYNAYFVDFQPQGRYLFPALPAIATQLALDKKVESNKVVRTLILLIGLLSLYSFYKIAYLNF